MPVVVLAGVDLVLIACILLEIGMLIALIVILRPALEQVASLVGRVPALGGRAAILVRKAENAVMAALNAELHASEAALRDLIRAFTWAFQTMVDSLKGWADDLNDAVKYLVNTRLGTVIHGITDPIRDTASAARTAADNAASKIVTEAKRLDGRIDGVVGAGIAAAATAKAEAIAAAEHYSDHALDVAEGLLRTEIHAATSGVTSALQPAIDAIRDAETAAEASLSRAIGQAEASADAYADRIIGTARTDLSALVAAAEAAAHAEAGVIGGEVADVNRRLSDLIGELDIPNLGTLLASVPALALLVHTIADESGLGRAECRAKTKAMCGLDPDIWGAALAGLVLVDGLPSLREIVDDAAALLETVTPTVVSMVRAAA